MVEGMLQHFGMKINNFVVKRKAPEECNLQQNKVRCIIDLSGRANEEKAFSFQFSFQFVIVISVETLLCFQSAFVLSKNAIPKPTSSVRPTSLHSG